MGITVGAVLESKALVDLFTVIGGEDGLGRQVKQRSIQRIGVALTGYTTHLSPERIQVIGRSECGYLGTLLPEDRLQLLVHVVSVGFPALLVTSGLTPPPELLELARLHNFVVIATQMESAEAIQQVNDVLARKLAPRETIHGGLLDVHGVGVLLLGKSGIGKSELALELVESGARLVADDAVVLTQLATGVIIGNAPELGRHHMEIRGLGIINVKELFGAAAVRERKRLELVVELTEWDPNAEYERLGVETRYKEIIGVPIPYIIVPVRPGRSMRLLVEVAARDQLLKAQGIHAAQAFTERLSGLLGQGIMPPEADHTEADLE